MRPGHAEVAARDPGCWVCAEDVEPGECNHSTVKIFFVTRGCVHTSTYVETNRKSPAGPVRPFIRHLCRLRFEFLERT
jgi:hypothetical protein